MRSIGDRRQRGEVRYQAPRARPDRRDTPRYYLNVPFQETLLRHATKPDLPGVGEEQLREWYRPLDLLPGPWETVIGADSALADTVERVLRETGLAGLPARED
ncbi:hypothetical protein ACF081_11125 [Streptomyces longwoodensis]|uniref:hypothetical protein n=1 Tax=Streptomyces longwoodensis TaxID=68231 RepID=UPI0036FE77FB